MVMIRETDSNLYHIYIISIRTRSNLYHSNKKPGNEETEYE